jgi:hypothetical protein
MLVDPWRETFVPSRREDVFTRLHDFLMPWLPRCGWGHPDEKHGGGRSAQRIGSFGTWWGQVPHVSER